MLQHAQPIKDQCCPECGSTRLMRDYEVAEIVCMDCGFVVAAKIADEGPEWRAFDGEQKAKRTRVGAPLTYKIHDKGLSTMIDLHDRDARGKSLSPEQKAEAYRLRKWQYRMRVSGATERNLAFALSEITKTADKLNVPKNIVETASVIYRKAAKKRSICGRPIQGVTAGAIYLACRQYGLARTLEEIAQASSVDKNEVGRNYRLLIEKLDYPIPPFKLDQYISRLSNQLSMQGRAEGIAHKVIRAARELRLTSGKSPAGIAAAASYIASVLTGERKTQEEIAREAQVTEVTIRNRYKELAEKLMYVVTL
ncbi:MAG: transcription initiation factor IIB [Candidatus Aenigmarchaeota archaeon]|nr:transcription initiation factor IIB [Candidatus Aenigmarchaeota archaeon]